MDVHPHRKISRGLITIGYTQPIIRDEDSIRYQEAAKHVFEPQWRFLASTRGLNIRRSEMTPALIAYKERQVFCQILTLMSISNRRELCHWRLINTSNYYGLGISNTVINQSTFYGTTYEPWVKPCISPRVHFGELSHLQANHGIMVNDADVVCQIAIDFQAHIESLKTIAHCRWVCSNVSSLSMNGVWVPTIGLHLFGR